MDSYCLLTFQSTHQFMVAEKILKDQFEMTIIPTLREISTGCGIAIKLNCSSADLACQKLADAGFSQTAFQSWIIRYENGMIIPTKEK